MSIYSSNTETPDLDSFVNRTGNFDTDGLSFGIRVVKARLRFGHLDLLVTPIFGHGERWVEQHRVHLAEQEAPVLEFRTGANPVVSDDDEDAVRIAELLRDAFPIFGDAKQS